jgi:membrane glycosyltransferase
MSPFLFTSPDTPPTLKPSKPVRHHDDDAMPEAHGFSAAELKRAKNLVAEYLRDAGVRDAGVIAAESHRLVMQSAAELKAKPVVDRESPAEAALRAAVRLLEQWLAAAKTSQTEADAAEPVVAVRLPELALQQNETTVRPRAGRLDDVPRKNLSTVVPTPRPRPMTKQTLALIPKWLGKAGRGPADAQDDGLNAAGTSEAAAATHSVLSCLNMVRALLIVATFVSTFAAASYFYADLVAAGRTGGAVALTTLFAVLFGWVSFSFWTATCGLLVVLRRSRRSASAKKSKRTESLPTSAVVMPIYNEDPRAVFANLRAMARSLQSTGHADRFHFFVLSDTTDPQVRLQEEQAWAAFAESLPADGPAAFYRHRPKNVSRKAGNIADFCRRWGSNYRFMTVLDADSIMAGATLVEMVRRMQRDPQLGILQVPPLPVNRQSLFARVQQFAARVYGQVFLEGFALWSQCDGNYWGHNAILRTRPFMDHCDLPVLPGDGPLGGEILSHDFVEAALMRKAGFKVCLAHDLAGSYEECPSTVLAYAQRDQRWCQGNMQHLRLLAAEGWHPVSRVHLGMGAMSYLTSPLWLCFLVFSLIEAMSGPAVETVSDGSARLWLFGLGMAMLMLPKLWGMISVWKLAKPSERDTWRRLGSGVVLEIVISMLIAPIMMLLHSRFVASTFLGRKVKWNAQQRNDCSVSFREAAAVHTGHTLFGVAIGSAVALVVPQLFWWMLPITAGLSLSIPLSMLLGSVRAGRALADCGLLSTPEETIPPPVLKMQRAALAQAEAGTAEEGTDPLATLLWNPWRYALHIGVLRATESHTPLADEDYRRLEETALNEGLSAIVPAQRRALLNDVHALESLHLLARSHRLAL